MNEPGRPNWRMWPSRKAVSAASSASPPELDSSWLKTSGMYRQLTHWSQHPNLCPLGVKRVTLPSCFHANIRPDGQTLLTDSCFPKTTLASILPRNLWLFLSIALGGIWYQGWKMPLSIHETTLWEGGGALLWSFLRVLKIEIRFSRSLPSMSGHAVWTGSAWLRQLGSFRTNSSNPKMWTATLARLEVSWQGMPKSITWHFPFDLFTIILSGNERIVAHKTVPLTLQLHETLKVWEDCSKKDFLSWTANALTATTLFTFILFNSVFSKFDLYYFHPSIHPLPFSFFLSFNK